MSSRPSRRDRRPRKPAGPIDTPIPPGAPPEVYDLGEPLSGIDITSLRQVILWGCVVLGVSLGVTGALLVASAPITAGIVGVVALGLLLFALDLFTTRSSLVWWVCPGGFVWKDGAMLTWSTWEEVSAFRVKVTTYIDEGAAPSSRKPRSWQRYDAVIRFANGREHELEGEELVTRVQRRVLRTLIRFYLEKIERGERVSMPPFELTRERLAHAGEEIAWDRVAEVAVENDTILVRTARAVWAEVPLEKCDLGSVFAGLAYGLARRAAGDERDPFDFG
jgi:hypothetical protein